MQAAFADIAVSMSELKKDPAAVLREANQRPVAVLNHNNKTAFYMVGPALFEVLIEELADVNLVHKVRARLAGKNRAVKVNFDEL